VVYETVINFYSAAILTGSFFLSVVGSWFMSNYAYRFGLLDIPNNRSSHLFPTPSGGGIGILLAFITASISLGLPLFFWCPITLLSLISFSDDRLGLSAIVRLAFQLAAAAVILAPPLLASKYSLPVAIILLVVISVFIAGTANFYNFMDGINGIAGISGVVGFGLLTIFSYINVAGERAFLLPLSIAIACLGFLPFNIPSARVFMGDVGSILLGFIFAVLCYVNSRSKIDLFASCGFLSTFYADALSTLYIRWRDGEKLSQAHRRHLYQLLANQLKIPHWKISLCYGACQLVTGLVLIVSHSFGLIPVIAVLSVFAIGWLIVSRMIRKRVEIMSVVP